VGEIRRITNRKGFLQSLGSLGKNLAGSKAPWDAKTDSSGDPLTHGGVDKKTMPPQVFQFIPTQGRGQRYEKPPLCFTRGTNKGVVAARSGSTDARGGMIPNTAKTALTCTREG